ncbi:MAG: NAD(+)/NADH kinase [Lachnospiraceae bacterium]|nr:NAD(+)/NADH kinase [Lachnospiraceae bacterium]
MEKYLIYTNPAKDEGFITTEYVERYLRKKGAETVRILSGSEGEFPEDIKCVIVIGGDGTVLLAAGFAKDSGVPIIGINLGSLGYLTEVEENNIDGALDALINGSYTCEERMMLKGTVKKAGKEVYDSFALNDIVIVRNGSLMVNRYALYVNDNFLNTYSGDGIIITTPTGSTGYNLSAGGPLVEPGAKLMIVTPICPHTLNQRSIILSPEDRIEIKIPYGKDNKVQSLEVNFDGGRKVSLTTGDSVIIEKGDKNTHFAKVKKTSFLEVLQHKLSEN